MHVYGDLLSVRGVHATRLPDQTEKPAQTDPLAARPDDSGGRQRVSILQTRFWQVEWRVFSSKTAATRPARPPLQMKASSVQIRQQLAIFHLDRRRFCSDLLRSDDFWLRSGNIFQNIAQIGDV